MEKMSVFHSQHFIFDPMDQTTMKVRKQLVFFGGVAIILPAFVFFCRSKLTDANFSSISFNGIPLTQSQIDSFSACYKNRRCLVGVPFGNVSTISFLNGQKKSDPGPVVQVRYRNNGSLLESSALCWYSPFERELYISDDYAWECTSGYVVSNVTPEMVRYSEWRDTLFPDWMGNSKPETMVQKANLDEKEIDLYFLAKTRDSWRFVHSVLAPYLFYEFSTSFILRDAQMAPREIAEFISQFENDPKVDLIIVIDRSVLCLKLSDAMNISFMKTLQDVHEKHGSTSGKKVETHFGDKVDK